MEEEKDVHSLSPVRTPKLQLLASVGGSLIGVGRQWLTVGMGAAATVLGGASL